MVMSGFGFVYFRWFVKNTVRDSRWVADLRLNVPHSTAFGYLYSGFEMPHCHTSNCNVMCVAVPTAIIQLWTLLLFCISSQIWPWIESGFFHLLSHFHLISTLFGECVLHQFVIPVAHGTNYISKHQIIQSTRVHMNFISSSSCI